MQGSQYRPPTTISLLIETPQNGAPHFRIPLPPISYVLGPWKPEGLAILSLRRGPPPCNSCIIVTGRGLHLNYLFGLAVHLALESFELAGGYECYIGLYRVYRVILGYTWFIGGI